MDLQDTYAYIADKYDTSWLILLEMPIGTYKMVNLIIQENLMKIMDVIR